MLKLLASTKLAVYLVLWLLVGVIANAQVYAHWSWITPPLIALAINLIGALISTKKLRVEPFLLVFHISLLAIILIAGLNQLGAHKGHVEIVEGGEFLGILDAEEAGPLLLSSLKELRFNLLAIEVNYQADGERNGTFARIQVTAPTNQQQEFVIGDHHPFIYQGYRFYTTHNKGFALLIQWQPNGSDEYQLGAIHLPSYPANALKQKLTWQPEGAKDELWMHLIIDQNPLEKGKAIRLRPPEDAKLVIRGNKRYEILAGQSIDLPDGQLTYLGIHSWMGFKVQYDRLISWLLAAALTAVLSLCAYLIQRRYFKVN